MRQATIGVPNCGNCKFFLPYRFPDQHDGAAGVCRRYPPSDPDGLFPSMRNDEWCGEYQECPA